MRKGFSLIELLIVVVIISLVYALGFSNFKIRKAATKALTPLNLKETIVKSEFFNGHATLMCVNKCRNCYLRQGVSSPFKAYSNKIDLSNIKAYTVDERESLRRLEYERYDDKKICLVMDFYNNGSSTQIILEDDKGAYFLPAFFGEPKRFDSPDDAKSYWLEQSSSVSNSGDYY
jgi:prepilin-type N-terminal cleavage/methylation domain-containing protein